MGERHPQPTKYEFGAGRLTTMAAVEQLVKATGTAPEEFLAAIQPLRDPGLGVVVRWASSMYNLEHPAGPASAAATEDYIVVHVPYRNVDGAPQNTDGVQRSHLIDTAADKFSCQSFEAFDGAAKWLMEKVITPANQ